MTNDPWIDTSDSKDANVFALRYNWIDNSLVVRSNWLTIASVRGSARTIFKVEAKIVSGRNKTGSAVLHFMLYPVVLAIISEGEIGQQKFNWITCLILS